MNLSDWILAKEELGPQTEWEHFVDYEFFILLEGCRLFDLSEVFGAVLPKQPFQTMDALFTQPAPV